MAILTVGPETTTSDLIEETTDLGAEEPVAVHALSISEHSQPSKNRLRSIVIARVAGVVLFIYFLMTILGQLPTNNTQEDLPGKDPFEVQQQLYSNDSATNMTSGTVVVQNR